MYLIALISVGFHRALLSSFVLLFNSGRANQTQDYIDFYFIVMNKRKCVFIFGDYSVLCIL